MVISDSFGRAWRHGITDVAIGVAGMDPVADYRGQRDQHGFPMEASVLAIADELAAAAELVMGKTDGIPWPSCEGIRTRQHRQRQSSSCHPRRTCSANLGEASAGPVIGL